MILKTENENNTHFKKIKKDIVPKRNTFFNYTHVKVFYFKILKKKN